MLLVGDMHIYQHPLIVFSHPSRIPSFPTTSRMMRPSLQGLSQSSALPLSTILELNDPNSVSQADHPCMSPTTVDAFDSKGHLRALGAYTPHHRPTSPTTGNVPESPISPPVLLWSDDGRDSKSFCSEDGFESMSPLVRPLHLRSVPPVQQEILPQSGEHTMMASELPAVWRSIGGVVSQMKAMQQQVNVSTAIHKVMSAILTEAAEVQEAKRKIKEDLVKGDHKLEAELGASIARVKLGNRLSQLRQQVTKLQELMASEMPPSEREVLEVLNELKVSRIKTIAAAALTFSRLKSQAADKGLRTVDKNNKTPTEVKGSQDLTYRSARGLPSLQLRRREPKAGGEDVDGLSGSGGVSGMPAQISADILEQIEARASRYSSGFSAYALAHASRQASLPRQSARQISPIGIPSLPKQRKIKHDRRTESLSMHMTPEIQEKVLARALQYSDTFSAIALRHATRQASFLRPTGPSADHQAQAPIGIPSLPKKRKMRSRKRAQAQVDEATWKASCSVLA